MEKLNNDDLLKQLPGNVYCKNPQGIIVWHNYEVMQELKSKLGIDSLLGKTIDEFLSPESAKKCRKNDLEILSKPPDFVEIKQEKLKLKNLETQTYITILKPSIDAKHNVAGIIVNSINLHKLFPNFDLKISKDKEFTFLLKEILILINLIKSVNVPPELSILLADLQQNIRRLFNKFNLLKTKQQEFLKFQNLIGLIDPNYKELDRLDHINCEKYAATLDHILL